MKILDREYVKIIKEIAADEKVKSMKEYMQHGSTSCYRHSLGVSYMTYKFCKKHGLDYRAAARAGLLHDFCLYDWHNIGHKGGYWHGFTHPKKALANAKASFEISELESDMIEKHMWPLTVKLPRYKETYALLWFDKVCSTRETVGGIIEKTPLAGRL